ncbi:MAG TPA: UV DNA damage repair endonuclease UvsE [Thermodesulfovibrionales bacterium]|nr:UV DNA damage repair endonuclease UvsE [Thermodesulfovibrionales bacterium]
MKIGYPCINLSLPCRSSQSFRLASYSEERMNRTIESNLACLSEIFTFNRDHELFFFRISSDLIPFASHPICRFPWQKKYKRTFKKIGDFIKRHQMRVSMHPDQFILINSPDKRIFQRSVKELRYHAEVLDLLEIDDTAKIQIHVGGAYGNKGQSIRRFIERYNHLDSKIKRRLVVENDERLFNIEDCLRIHEKIKIPIVFDVFHFKCNNRGESIRAALSQVCSTWTRKDGLPIVDYSSQEKGKRIGSHAKTIHLGDFKRFIKETEGLQFDIMCEIKDKERSALRALKLINQIIS